jgi:hypothetical protein
MAAAAHPKPSATSQDAPKPTPQSSPKKRKADRTGPTTASKPPAKKAKVNNAMKGITAPNPRAVKRPAVEDKGELDMFPKERDVLAPKAKKAVEKEEHRDAVLAARNGTPSAVPKHKAAAPRPTTPPITGPILKPTRLEECLPLQRMKDDALEQLKERRENARMALGGLMPLIKNNEAIETAVAALEEQVENCDRDIGKLMLFGRGFETGKIKGTDKEVSIRILVYS